MGNSKNPTDKRDQDAKGERDAGLERNRQAQQQGQDLQGKAQAPGNPNVDGKGRDAQNGKQQGGVGKREQQGQSSDGASQQGGPAGGATSKPDGESEED